MDKIIYIILIILFAGLIHSNFYQSNNATYKQFILQEELDKKINTLNNLLEQQKKLNQQNQSNQQDQQDQRNIIPQSTRIVPIPVQTQKPDIVDVRDMNVVENPLYPLYGRSERPIIDMLMNNNMVNIRTRGSEDTYHPVGYAKDTTTNDIFYLMGRQRYRGSSQGDFYLISTDTTNRLKINLLDNSGNQIIKDIYNVPNSVTINSGIFNGKTFEIEQLKNTDLISPYY